MNATDAPPPLRPEELGPPAPGAAVGRRIVHLGETDSTSDRVWELARAGEPEGVVVSADAQSRGRGRSGNDWHSAPRLGLWFSVLLRPALAPEHLGRITCLAGVAVAEALRGAASVDARIKWPNDVWIGRRKVAGILSETRNAGPGRAVVVGVGLNVHHRTGDFPPALRDTATSLRIEGVPSPDRTRLFAALLRALHLRYEALRAGEGGATEERYRALSLLPGLAVRLRCGKESLRGTVEDLSCTEGLSLRLPGGRVRRFRAEHITQVEPEGP